LNVAPIVHAGFFAYLSAATRTVAARAHRLTPFDQQLCGFWPTRGQWEYMEPILLELYQVGGNK
jgi:hypothetical protein